MLILLPNLLGASGEELLPPAVEEAVLRLDGLIAESVPAGRRFLARYREARSVPIAEIKEDPEFLLEPLLAGETWGLVSDAGLPCLADPGSALVGHARKKGIEIVAIPGPSAIMLALMLSGLKSQRFFFHGYLKTDRFEPGVIHIAIEAPYKNRQTLQHLIETLPANALLCVAWQLTQPDQGVITKSVEQWRKSELPDIHKKPAIFLFMNRAQIFSPRRRGRRRGP